ncbi:MAG: N-6 DNA methylase [Nitrospirae bacterium]|nr:N-6 DNA methylase [Nitrospirota bacterium]
MEKHKIPDEVSKLIERFERNHDAYRSGQYNETQLRREFIDPFFETLGWDVNNKQGYAEPYKDVIHEDAIKIGSATKAPDYCFRIGGTRKFFVETKKPSVNLKDDISPAFQLRRYAWSAKLPLSVLTDFEEFAVYDCRITPVKTDKASTARILYLTYKEYVHRWEEIASIFSREAILKGSFDKYAETGRRKRGTAEVDNAFLKEIESWRDILARNIALRNPDLSQRELNFSIQRTIDRVIFLRICEDRGIEQYGRLMSLMNGSNVYRRLLDYFRQADEKYNSGLFHFNREKDRHETPDELTPFLSVDDRNLKDIINRLYYPESPYEFAVLPADILGQVYEQFLGKVIRLTPGHQAKVEEKPEVRKAGGVYYTPTYIVDYIVKNTVGKLIGDKTTTKDVSKLRILDPACGSGSFLLGAYQYLLDWHRDWYINDDPGKWAKAKNPSLYQAQGGDWHLTTAEKKRILLNNIYGVDIDSQAVEVTKLSLLLKVLEGENNQTIERQLKFYHERALPDLGDNIKCGNSLIGSDFYDNTLPLIPSHQGRGNYFADSLAPRGRGLGRGGIITDEERLRINVFDWEKEFPEIMKAGGFDAVIGNPPYVDIKGLPEIDVQYIFSKYPTANNRINLFAAFIERSLGVCNSLHFRFSMIIPTALLTQESYCALRRMIIDNHQVTNVVRLPNESFGSAAGDVKVDTVIIVIEQKSKKDISTELIGYAGYDRIMKIEPTNAQVFTKISQSTWEKAKDCVWSINTNDADNTILAKCEEKTLPLEECADFSLGLTPYDKYKGHTPAQIESRVFHATSKKDKTFRKLLAGNDVMRYNITWNGKEWISYGPWLGAPREERFFTEKRILVKQIIDWTTKRIWASITDEELYNTQNAFNLLARQGWRLEYLLGIINSRLMTFYHRKKFLDEFKMRFQKILIKDCCRFAIRVINFSDSADKARHDKMVSMVDQMLTLNKKLASAKTDHEKTALQRQIEATDKQIDKLVYELYGLTEEEIGIVEGKKA